MENYEDFIGIREFLERLNTDFFTNPFTTDTGKPANNIPSLDDIDNEGNVSTCQSLNY